MIREEKLLLKPDDFEPSFSDWRIHGVLNPGSVRMKDDRIALYVRIAESVKENNEKVMKCPVIVSRDEYKASSEIIQKKKITDRVQNLIFIRGGKCRLLDISHFRQVVLGSSGFAVEKIYGSPAFTGIPGESDYGVEDARIVRIKDEYFMTYVAVSKGNGICSALAVSKDLNKWERKGIIFQEQNKDAVLFPEKIKGKYVALNRPEATFAFRRPHIWISYSNDLIYWGREKSLLETRENSWEDERNGAGAPPVKTKEGWLVIYHGLKKGNDKKEYSAGAVLLDLKNPEKILARTPRNRPLIKPERGYEKEGFMDNVVFPTAAIPDLNKKDLLIYSGGADSVVTVKKISFAEIFKSMEYY